MKIVVAPDKFKGSLTATAVAGAIMRGLRASREHLDIVCVPVADGGDGTVDAAVAAGFDRHLITVAGPTGEQVECGIALRQGTAVVELASVCGIELLPHRILRPLVASSFGLGQALSAALDAGATSIVLGLGGSASTDGGAGMLQALGGRLLDRAGQPVGRGGRVLADIAEVDLSPVSARFAGIRVVLASDVDNPLLGPSGSAAVYGPQKGATADDVAALDRGLAHWAHLVSAATGTHAAGLPGAGAAGGVGFAAQAVLNATTRPGIEVVLELAGFRAALAGADLVVTGEGHLDAQTLRGKAVAGVARLAVRANVPVVAIAGAVTVTPEQLHELGVAAAYSLGTLEPDQHRRMTDAADLTEQLAAQILSRH